MIGTNVGFILGIKLGEANVTAGRPVLGVTGLHPQDGLRDAGLCCNGDAESCHRGSSTQEFYSAGRVTHSLGIHRRDRTFALLSLGRLGLWAGSRITASLLNKNKSALTQQLGISPSTII